MSGRYRNHHSKRVAIDRSKNSEKAAERFWQTHDLILLRESSTTRKRKLCLERAAFEQNHGDAAPQATTKGEGFEVSVRYCFDAPQG